MPRRARLLSETNYYHVMLRGINRQQIFEEDEDCIYFLNLLKRYKEACGFKLTGYCLMGNHVHLLIGIEEVSLPVIMKKIGAAYAYYFNKKYGRIGHLFQDRYRSEPIADDVQLLVTLRYIHRNPVKASLCRHCKDYVFSSFAEYLSERWYYADGTFVFGMMDKEHFLLFSEEENQDKCLEMTETAVYRKTDQEAKRIMMQVFGGKTVAEFQLLDKTSRNEVLYQLYQHGLSVTQICRLTGISRGTVARNIK